MMKLVMMRKKTSIVRKVVTIKYHIYNDNSIVETPTQNTTSPESSHSGNPAPGLG